MRRNKCRGKNPSMCVDPRCPEKHAVINAMNKAIANGDLDAYAKARQVHDKHLKALFIREAENAQEWSRLIVQAEGTETRFSLPIMPEADLKHLRKELEDDSFDPRTSPIREFSELSDMQDFFRKSSSLYVRINEEKNYSLPDRPVESISLYEFYVAPEHRGTGLGSYVMRTITNYADKNKLPVSLTPTEVGTGKYEYNDDRYLEDGETHRKRLIAYYEKNGFFMNPFFVSCRRRGRGDAANEYRLDCREDERERLDAEQPLWSPAARKWLVEQGEMVRFPNGKIPPRWKKKPQN